MKQQTPISVDALTGVSIRTAEAARVRNQIIRLLAVEFKERFHDLSQLPVRHGKSPKAERRIAALQVPAVRQAYL